MSGALAATIIAGVTGAAALGGTAYSIVNGQNQQAAQQTALKKQNTAQQTATAAALSTERQAAVAEGAANAKTPDISGILQRAATAGKGTSSTMLTGPTGVNPSNLNLGGATLLGS